MYYIEGGGSYYTFNTLAFMSIYAGYITLFLSIFIWGDAKDERSRYYTYGDLYFDVDFRHVGIKRSIGSYINQKGIDMIAKLVFINSKAGTEDSSEYKKDMVRSVNRRYLCQVF